MLLSGPGNASQWTDFAKLNFGVVLYEIFIESQTDAQHLICNRTDGRGDVSHTDGASNKDWTSSFHRTRKFIVWKAEMSSWVRIWMVCWQTSTNGFRDSGNSSHNGGNSCSSHPNTVYYAKRFILSSSPAECFWKGIRDKNFTLSLVRSASARTSTVY